MIKKRNFIKIATISGLISLIIGGCAAPTITQNLEAEADAVNRSSATTRISKFSDALRNLGRLAETYRDEPFYLTVWPVENKTAAIGKLPADITVMVESAVNSISSDKIRAIPYDLADPSKVDERYDYFYIKGAITEFDAVEKKGAGFSLGAAFTAAIKGKNRDSDADATFGKGLEISAITIDFNVVDARTNQFVSGVHTQNTMKMANYNDNYDMGFSIAGTGFGINGTVNKQRGVHGVLRLLVDLSIVELIGKLRTYPYWICVYNGKVDNNLLAKMKKDFNAYNSETKLIYIQHLLSIIYPDVTVDTNRRNITYKRIMDFKRDNDIIPVNNEITTELYVKLLTEIPKILTKKGWDNKIKGVFAKVLNY